MIESDHSLLEQFERAVFQRDKIGFSQATNSLHLILANLEKLGGDVAHSKAIHFHSRLADAVTALLLDRQFEMTLPAFQLLCGSHAALSSVFACSAYQTGDHIISQLANIEDMANLHFDSLSTLMKCLLSYSLASEYDLEIHQLSEQFPDVVAAILLGHLSYTIYSRQAIERKIDKILSTPWPVLHKVTPSLPMIVTTSTAWMNCSYAHSKNKHQIKRDLNAMIRNGLTAQGIKSEQTMPQGKLKNRPTVILPLEIFTSNHAMYRCFSRCISRLSETFKLIAVSPQDCIDARASELFDEVIKFDPAQVVTDMKPLIKQIEKCSPDLLYYPSLGMANYSLQLAQTRLAPVQCFTLGHPATSYIDTIDYVIVQEQDFTNQSVYSETVILTGNDTSPTINRVREHVTKPGLREQPEVIKIAVTSKQMKINFSFLKCCAAISSAANRPLEFYFFPGVNGYLYEFVRHEILRILPNSRVYPTTDYDTYIKNMDQCDLRLGTFPFGGANTNMDCFGLGIPFVILDGEQPHAHSDTAQLEQADMPEWLIAHSLDDYVSAALRLIENDQERIQISRKMMTLYQNDFFYKSARDESMLFDKTLLWLYKNHQQLQQAGQKVWTLEQQGLA